MRFISFITHICSKWHADCVTLVLNEQLEGNRGFRLSVGAGVWYEALGVIAEYNFGKVGPHGELPRYDRLSISLLVRY